MTLAVWREGGAADAGLAAVGGTSTKISRPLAESSLHTERVDTGERRCILSFHFYYSVIVFN
jgi:hypothetical protein